MSAKLLCVGMLLSLVACGPKSPGEPAEVAASAPLNGADLEAGNSASDEQFFSFALDGAPMQIPIDDVLVSMGFGGVLKVYAGPDQKLSLTLTIPDIARCPCTIPAGSTEPGTELAQGSVSLQNHPNPGNALNSWYLGQLGDPAASAITVTDIGVPADGSRYISGEFGVTVLKTESNGDGPENRDYAISNGRFRLKLTNIGPDGF